MAKNSRSRQFNGMSYREVQRSNSTRRQQLRSPEQKWLKENQYRNVGWEFVIQLYQKIDEFLEQYNVEKLSHDLSLEELFLEADRIGNKYQTDEEKTTFNQALAQELGEIAEAIDRQFPDTEIEVIDFSNPQDRRQRSLQKSNRKVSHRKS